MGLSGKDSRITPNNTSAQVLARKSLVVHINDFWLFNCLFSFVYVHVCDVCVCVCECSYQTFI